MLGLVCNTQKQKKNLVTRFLSFSHPNVADRSFVCVVAIRYMSTTDVLALSHSTFMIVYGIYLLRLRILAMEFNAASWSTTLVPAAHLYRSMHASSAVTPAIPGCFHYCTATHPLATSLPTSNAIAVALARRY